MLPASNIRGIAATISGRPTVFLVHPCSTVTSAAPIIGHEAAISGHLRLAKHRRRQTSGIGGFATDGYKVAYAPPNR
jgi:hypothetical protein